MGFKGVKILLQNAHFVEAEENGGLGIRIFWEMGGVEIFAEWGSGDAERERGNTVWERWRRKWPQ